MLSRFCKTLLLMLCCWLLTGPQLLLPLGAWSWMITSYSQESTIEQAIKETFGGERPCDLCKIIQAVDEAGQDLPLNTGKPNKLTLMLGLAKPIYILSPSAQVETRTCIEWKPESAHTAVPTPPPRLA